MFEYIAYTTKGGKQDCIMVNATIKFEGQIKGKEEKKMFALVCNGIGDNDSGEKASGLAALEFSKFDIQNASAYSLNEYINRINKYIINMQKKIDNCEKMATKVGGIILFENKYLIFNVGDMRVYESRNGVLSLKTANLFLNEGEHRKIYFSDCIGGDGLVCNTNIIRGTISEDERLFLICGDGICSQLDHDKVCSILKKNENLENKKRAIIQETKKNGSLDNESFVLIRFVK